ncbi:MAG: mannose-6-phosphate isomerase [Thomasclavelia sp.]|jgi:mannose-6-phosphate isomerase|nr:mannose-6-phosphate isomerase [Thomasclavelia sp.]
MSVLFFKPIPRPAIWGKTLVRDYFGYNDFPVGIGQSWSFSAQKDASTICATAPYEGQTLYDLWNNHQELFGHPGEDFPVIISLVGPEDDLSIQVHPDAKYAKQLGLPSGKNEAWYFIDSKPGANIVYGHKAISKEDLYNYINNNKWDDLIKHLEVHTGDFVYLPAGLLHALRKGSIVYEIQQAVDITYRFYDYHRKDNNGNERELHLQQAIDCLSYNQKDMVNNIHPVVTNLNCGKQTVYISNESFTVTKLEIDGENEYFTDNYQLATVVKGKGKVDGENIKLGDSFLIPQNTKIKLSGHMTIMMTTK